MCLVVKMVHWFNMVQTDYYYIPNRIQEQQNRYLVFFKRKSSNTNLCQYMKQQSVHFIQIPECKYMYVQGKCALWHLNLTRSSPCLIVTTTSSSSFEPIFVKMVQSHNSTFAVEANGINGRTPNLNQIWLYMYMQVEFHHSQPSTFQHFSLTFTSR